jgi:succinyl-diaminopimelate desuccinylase
LDAIRYLSGCLISSGGDFVHQDANFEGAVAFAQDLIRIPSVSGNEGSVAERVVEELKRLRFDDVWVDEVGNVIAHVRGRSQAPSVMLCSHLDVVDVGDPTQWEYPPFSGEIANGCLHGRGAIDCKGPLALQLYAAATLINSRPAGDVYLLCTVLEESGSWGMNHFMKHGAFRPAAVILGEATAGDICVGHRGRRELMITIRGKSAHASAPQRGCNPVDFLPSVLDALRSFVESLPIHNVLGHSTLVPTLIETWPGSRNMIPEEVRIIIDWRTLSGESNKNTVEDLQIFLRDQLKSRIGDNLIIQEVVDTKRMYTGFEYTGRISTSSFLMPDTHPLVQAAVQAVRAATGITPAARPWTFGTDGGCSCGVYGIPTLGYAPGQEADAHTNRERLRLDAAHTVYEAYPTLISELQKLLTSGIVLDS